MNRDELEQVLRSAGMVGQTILCEGVHGVLETEVPIAEAIGVWAAARVAHASTGYWPILRGPREDVVECAGGPADILSGVHAGSARELLRFRLEERCEVLASFVPGLDPSMGFDAAAAAMDSSGTNSFSLASDSLAPGVWPREQDVEPKIIDLVTLSRSSEPVVVAFVPTAKPHEAPAFFGFGGWNDVPMPETIVGVLREWERSYGAVPVCIAGDVIECIVDRPPTDESQSMALAAEQWVFCDDIVAQGTQTVRALALALWRSPQWFFWWD